MMATLFKSLTCILLMVCLPAIGLSDSNGYWFDRADMPTARQEILPGELDGKIYVIGGWLNGTSITDLVEMFDPVTNTWSTPPPLPRPLHHCAVVSVDGLLYVVGGYINTTWLSWIAYDTVLAYNPATEVWTARAPMNVGRGEHSAVVYQGKIYVTGGNYITGMATPVVEVYDPVADTWTQLSYIPTPRHHHASVVIDTMIYVVGGRQGPWEGPLTSISTIEAYAPASDTWYTICDMPTPRGGLSAASVDGRLYTFGGEIPGLFENVEEYDPELDSWRSLTPMLTPRHGTAAVVIEDTVFVIGGGRLSGIAADNSNQGFVLGTCVDTDYDGYSDSNDPENTCPPDNCPEIYNPEQEDSDGDMIGDLCDDCPIDPDNDGDGDSWCANEDNCPSVYNPEQEDTDFDNIGDSCCCLLRGDINHDSERNISDLTYYVDYMFAGGLISPCPEEGDVDYNGERNISDLTYYVDYMFGGGPPPGGCS